MPSREWTIGELLRWATGYFQRKGIDSPRITAEVLLARGLKLERLDLYLRYDQPLNDRELAPFKTLIQRRLSREPVAYITGNKEFWSLDLEVSPAVLIPRPETECLVEAALDCAARMERGGTLRLLDLGTGSGAIALALASSRPGDWIVATDVSPAALAVARKNAMRHRLAERVHFVAADWLSAFRRKGYRFHLIVSNPPYIEPATIDRLAPEIRDHEPRLALNGRSGGLECVHHILTHAPECLEVGGRLLLEIGHDQRRRVETLVAAAGCYEDVQFLKDYGGMDRVASLRRAEGRNHGAD